MGIGKTFPVIDSNGNPVQFTSGKYYCFNCKKLRKFIPYPHKATIEPCKCGSIIVFLMD